MISEQDISFCGELTADMSEKRHARKLRNECVNIVRGTELSCCDLISALNSTAVFVFEERGSSDPV